MQSNRAVVSAVVGLLSAAHAAGQVGRVSLFTLPDDVPGISGPYTFSLAQEFVTVNNNGRVAFWSGLIHPAGGATQYGLFVMGGGIPLTNVVDTNADVVTTEFGVDDVLTLVPSAELRDDNSLRFRANLDTPYPAADGNDSKHVELEWDGSGIPAVTLRRVQDIYAPGTPVAAWHETSLGPDGAPVWVYDRDSHTVLPTTNDGRVGEVFATHDSPAITNGQTLPGVSNPRIRFPGRPIAGDSGSVAFTADLDLGSGPDPEVVIFGRPGEGYGPLFDPREPATAFPGAPSGVRVANTWVLGIAANDSVRVRAAFVDEVTGEYVGSGIWSFRSDGSPVVPILVEGEAAPGLAPGNIVFDAYRATPRKMINSSHWRVTVFVQDVSSGDQRRVIYDIGPDDSVIPFFDTADAIQTPGVPGGPYTIFFTDNNMFDKVVWMPDGRFVARSDIRSAQTPLGKSAVSYVDESGTARTLAVQNELFDFEPTSVGGEREISWAKLHDVSSEGKAVFEVLAVGDERTTIVVVDLNAPLCPADANNDGVLTPADFNAWILAFNTNAPECDQNNDDACTPADFNAWIANFNAGC